MKLGYELLALSALLLTAVSATVLSFTDHTIVSLKETLPSAEWVILFYADWCGACRMFKPAFHQFAEDSASKRPQLKFAAINYADGPISIMRFGINSLPSIYHIRHGEYRDISDHRRDLEKYFDEEAWKDIAPVMAWMLPFSIFGNIMAYVSSIGLRIMTFVSRLQTMEYWRIALLIMSIPLGLILIALTAALLGRYLGSRRVDHLSDKKKQ